MTSTYVPQNHPLFVAIDNVPLPSNIGELDPEDASYAASRAVKDQLRIERVVAWLIEDTAEGNVTAKPVTMFGLGIPSTVAESSAEVRATWTRDLHHIATAALDQLAKKKGNRS